MISFHVRSVARHELEILAAIFTLQQANIKHNLTKEERKSSGFLSWRTPTPVLQLLCDQPDVPGVTVAFFPSPSRLAAYLLLVSRETTLRLEKLGLSPPSVGSYERCEFHGVPIAEHTWFMLGQVCCAREARGSGAVESLYRFAASELLSRHSRASLARPLLIVTDVAEENQRSRSNLIRNGYREVGRYHQTYEGETSPWIIVAVDVETLLRNSSARNARL